MILLVDADTVYCRMTKKVIHCWRTLKGETIPVTDLEDSHLRNILRMLVRGAPDAYRLHNPEADVPENGIDVALAVHPKGMSVLLAEAERRKGGRLVVEDWLSDTAADAKASFTIPADWGFEMMRRLR